MAILIAYYSRAGENYFGGSYRRIPVGNTRRVAEQLASLTGGDLLELRQAQPLFRRLPHLRGTGQSRLAAKCPSGAAGSAERSVGL